MPRVILTLALVLVLGSAAFVKADGSLREPPFPGAGAGEGGLMTFNVPDDDATDDATSMWKVYVASLLRMASFYR